MIKKILIMFLAWRLFLFIPLFLSEHFVKFREGFNYTSPSYFSPISHFLLAPWANFDGVYYLIIAARGYTVDNSGFFPLFPLIINAVSSIFGSVQAFDLRQYFIALILASVFLASALLFIHKLVRFDYDSNVAMLTILAVLVFPTSFFFASIYSESLFLLLTILSFYFARKKKWLFASVFGSLLTATRVVGIAIIPALIYEFIKNEKNLFQKKALSLLLTPLGLLLYMYFNLKEWGNPLQFMSAQGNLANERSIDQIILFPQTIYRYFNILTNVSPSIYEWWIALLELSAFIFASIMLLIAWKKKIRFSYILFSIVALLIPASTGTFTGMPRYVLILFPIFIALSLVKNKWIKYAYSVIGLILLAVLFALFSKGYYIA